MSDLKPCPLCGGPAPRKPPRCPQCGSPVVECNLYYGRHEMHCAACGLIEHGDTFDAAADKWRELVPMGRSVEHPGEDGGVEYTLDEVPHE